MMLDGIAQKTLGATPGSLWRQPKSTRAHFGCWKCVLGAPERLGPCMGARDLPGPSCSE
jgi:hypothetical protein